MDMKELWTIIIIHFYILQAFLLSIFTFLYKVIKIKNMYQKSLFIFRQDLRLEDNTGLFEAMKNSQEVFPIFIHDERAISDF